MRCLLGFQVETWSRPDLWILGRWGRGGSSGERSQRTGGGSSVLLTGQVRGRVSTDLGIWGMGPSPTVASIQGLDKREV